MIRNSVLSPSSIFDMPKNFQLTHVFSSPFLLSFLLQYFVQLINVISIIADPKPFEGVSPNLANLEQIKDLVTVLIHSNNSH